MVRKELDEKLCRDFPLLYEDRTASMQSTLMCWGFDCEDGWFGLIYNLSSDIEKEIKELIAEDNTVKMKLWILAYRIMFAITGDKKYSPFSFYYPKAVQVKEKYGGLRFYMTCGSDRIFNLIGKAEEDSLRICEHCGNPGKETGDGWIRTLCEPCELGLDKWRKDKAKKWEISLEE